MRRLVIMRGLPFCGKSTRAKEILAQYVATGRTDGVIYSTDDFFETENGYTHDARKLAEYHARNQQRALAAMELRYGLIIIDNTNTIIREFCCSYVKPGLFHDYRVEFEEPRSPHWKIIGHLLQNKAANQQKLDKWAAWLSEASRATHNVPVEVVQKWMARWEPTIDLEDLLRYCSGNHNFESKTQGVCNGAAHQDRSEDRCGCVHDAR